MLYTLSTALSTTHTSCLLKYQIAIAQCRVKTKWNSACELDPLKHEDIPIYKVGLHLNASIMCSHFRNVPEQQEEKEESPDAGLNKRLKPRLNPSTLNKFTSCLSSAACSLCWAQPSLARHEQNKTSLCVSVSPRRCHGRRSGKGVDDTAEAGPSREPGQAQTWAQLINRG